MSGDSFRYLLFNRDEQVSRETELPPSLSEPAHMPRYLAPHDPKGGGTWICANEYGLVAAVLNPYEKDVGSPEKEVEPATSNFTSRGVLPLVAVGSKRIDDAADAIESTVAKGAFRPFLLLLMSGDRPAEDTSMAWDGQRLSYQKLFDFRQPLTTSSFESGSVIAHRRKLYQDLSVGDPKLHELLDFHSIFDHSNPAFGPAMVREDATTRSLCTVKVGTSEVVMRHQFFDPTTTQFLAPSEVRLRRKIL